MKSYPNIDDYENREGYAINKNWLDELALHTQVVKKKSELNYQHGRLLYTTLSKYIEKQKPTKLNIIESGTARGFSALCMAKAMADLQKEGTILTFDILPHRIKMFWNCIDDTEGEKSRAELLSSYYALVERYIVFFQGDTKVEMSKVHFPRVNFAFLDGAHHYTLVMSEFACIRDSQKEEFIPFFVNY